MSRTAPGRAGDAAVRHRVRSAVWTNCVRSFMSNMPKPQLVFVHGIGDPRDPDEALTEWKRALAGGARAAGFASDISALTMDWMADCSYAYHGDLFTDGESQGAGDLGPPRRGGNGHCPGSARRVPRRGGGPSGEPGQQGTGTDARPSAAGRPVAGRRGGRTADNHRLADRNQWTRVAAPSAEAGRHTWLCRSLVGLLGQRRRSRTAAETRRPTFTGAFGQAANAWVRAACSASTTASCQHIFFVTQLPGFGQRHDAVDVQLVCVDRAVRSATGPGEFA